MFDTVIEKGNTVAENKLKASPKKERGPVNPVHLPEVLIQNGSILGKCIHQLKWEILGTNTDSHYHP